MCIRDRDSPDLDTGDAEEGAAAPEGVAPPPLRAGRREREPQRGCGVLDSRNPVSYTHLTLPTICSV
eukprot:8740613-Alexandrium_andersonii.AAC.1